MENLITFVVRKGQWEVCVLDGVDPDLQSMKEHEKTFTYLPH